MMLATHHVIEWIRSIGLALYGMLFGLSCYMVWVGFKERNRRDLRWKRLWTAAIWVGLGTTVVAGYGASRRWDLFQSAVPLSWGEFWASLQAMLLIVGISLAMRAGALQRPHNEQKEDK